MQEEEIFKIVSEFNKTAKHQQDLVQYEGGVCRCICVGCHASGPHLLKTLVKVNKCKKDFLNKHGKP